MATSITKWSCAQAQSKLKLRQVSIVASHLHQSLPWEFPEMLPDVGRNGESSSSVAAGGKSTVVPESFEQQMMLAMTLALAGTQPRVH